MGMNNTHRLTLFLLNDKLLLLISHLVNYPKHIYTGHCVARKSKVHMSLLHLNDPRGIDITI